MKRFFKKLLEVIESLGRAKAAASLSRQGLHKQARELMLKD
jgi:hypothetical protein